MTEIILINWLLWLLRSLAGMSRVTHPAALLITLCDEDDSGSWWNHERILASSDLYKDLIQIPCVPNAMLKQRKELFSCGQILRKATFV